ncbi:leucine-rich repeat-containing protein 47 [Megalops cyprinoides]|uniref:leucine-rich repeat-containing protein 47 n=1 Tax=Megalops cyprinoides TaxID=118141 RepID=UPI00186534B8|nr:leucine-rich repeat-containing protein 47 [Megalops cyprinoides]
MAGMEESGEKWAEIERAASEKRRELVLQGPNIDKKIQTGGLNPSIYSLTLLNYLEISQCPSLLEIHEEIQNLTHLQSLILCRNKISTIPKAVGSLKSLKVLDVSVNELKALPDELSQLSELNTLNVSCNKITGLPNGLSKCAKLSSINISKNEISRLPEDLYSAELELLSTIIASENAIEELSGDISNLPALKNLDLSNNKLSDIPFDLADCSKLKEINFKGNKLKDKRLEKMVNGCQTKSILDYLRAGGRGKGKGKQPNGSEKEDGGKEKDKKKRTDRRQKNKKDEDEVEEVNRMVVKVLHVSDNPTAFTVKVAPQLKDVRPYIVCCIVKGMNLKPGNALKRFLAAQIKLHDEICGKRTTATIATHDFELLHWPLLYDARPPKTLKIVPLGRKEMNAVDLMRQLQLEAEEQRKQKKRQNVSGLHKYLQLLDGKENYPCVVDAQDHVISFPPITNSEKTKMRKSTSTLFVEVTSSTSLQICKDVMDSLIVKMAELNKFTFDHKEESVSDGESDLAGNDKATEPAANEMTSSELLVQQVRIVDTDGNLKVVYPSKTDLASEVPNLTVVR